MHVATAHLVADCAADGVLTEAMALLRTRFGVEHATLQVESGERNCSEVSW
jgi:cobalt-zinc-cadmium efflux system protein